MDPGLSQTSSSQPETPPAGSPPAGRPAVPVAAGLRRGNPGRAYALTVLAFILVTVVAGILNESFVVARATYAVTIFVLCSGLYFFGGSAPRHRLMSMFMACYFAIFGMAAFIYLLIGELPVVQFGRGEVTADDLAQLTTSDVAIILGGLAALGGYFSLNAMRGNRKSKFLAYEWRYSTVLKTGIALWVIGFVFMLAYDTTASVFYIPRSVLGLPTGVASNLRLMAPLGALMLVYLITRQYRLPVVWTVLLMIMVVEFIFGFIVSSKELSFRISALLLLAFYYLHGRLNWKILAVIVVVAIPYLLYFNAYRLTMMEQAYLNSGTAFESFDQNMKAVEKRTAGAADVAVSSLRGLMERIDGKRYVDIITTGTKSGKVDFLYGETLTTFFASWIPRVFWPEKPDISTGQMFNRAFGLSASPLTMVPTTIPGELYWNFSMPGVIVGMFLIGMFFGLISAGVSHGASITLPRFLVLLLATYFLAIRLEGNIATQFSIFLRLALLVWLIDKLYRSIGWSRRVRAVPVASKRPVPSSGGAPPPPSAGPRLAEWQPVNTPPFGPVGSD